MQEEHFLQLEYDTAFPKFDKEKGKPIYDFKIDAQMQAHAYRLTKDLFGAEDPLCEQFPSPRQLNSLSTEEFKRLRLTHFLQINNQFLIGVRLSNGWELRLWKCTTVPQNFLNQKVRVIGFDQAAAAKIKFFTQEGNFKGFQILGPGLQVKCPALLKTDWPHQTSSEVQTVDIDAARPFFGVQFARKMQTPNRLTNFRFLAHS